MPFTLRTLSWGLAAAGLFSIGTSSGARVDDVDDVDGVEDRPARHADLVGRPFAAALERHGPPESGAGTAGCVGWRWRDDGGGWILVSVHQDVVLHVDERHGKGAVPRRDLPAAGTYPGQPVAELLARLGAPERVTPVLPPVTARDGRPTGPGGPPQYAADLMMHYPDQRLLVAAGRVLGPVPPEPAIHGPRGR